MSDTTVEDRPAVKSDRSSCRISGGFWTVLNASSVRKYPTPVVWSTFQSIRLQKSSPPMPEEYEGTMLSLCVRSAGSTLYTVRS